MKISYIKFKGDNKNFRLAKGMGFDVFELEEPEQIDIELKKLKNKNYDTIVITNELASFSSDLISKYESDNKIRIIITPSKKN